VGATHTQWLIISAIDYNCFRAAAQGYTAWLELPVARNTLHSIYISSCMCCIDRNVQHCVKQLDNNSLAPWAVI